MSLLNDLNPVQQKAVLKTEGPLLVFAGAGSGKTRVLTYKIAYLIREKNVPPWNILAVTFTNKAADEMRERVQRLLGGSAQGAWISTFHSACVRILRRHIEPLGFKRNFVIYDEQDQDRHLKAVMREQGLDFKIYHPRALQSEIEQLKRSGITPDQYRPSQFNIFQKRLAQVYQRYQENLRRNNALDFEDLLAFVDLLFRRFPDILRSYQELWRYVMVDEFQDTNLIQYRLIQQIVQKHRNIFVVGDDDQSIYRWRGAEVGNILNFEKDFPEAKVIALEQNYRSTQHILRAANEVVLQNRLRKKKTLWTENPEGDLLTLYVAEDEKDEARFVSRKLMELCRLPSGSNPIPEGEGSRLRDIAVFYRMNAQSRAIEDELVRNRIPYTVVGGMKFYERKEIKDILAYLKVMANPSDGVSLGRIINTPPRGIGEKTIEKIEAFSKEEGIPLYDGLKEALRGGTLSASAGSKIAAFVELMEELQKEAGAVALSQLTLTLLDRTGYLNRLEEERTDEALSKVENIEELISVMKEFEREGEAASLETFLDRVSLVSDIDLYDDKGNRVSLMTLHCAKGLEFPIVFMVGMEEGVLPHYRRGEEIEDMEEERRLCYVGITRAREQLFLSRAETRTTFGVGRSNLSSRFLDELPMELIRFEGKEIEKAKAKEDLFSERERWDDLLSQAAEPFPGQPFDEWPSRDDSSLPVERSLSPEGFYPLKVGMRVRHLKFGEGRVTSVEGMDENQKATILFRSVGSKRVKVCWAPLEILE
jgi:DNA helicase II / ATP-dependent DNA helicase PcrA